MGISIEDPFDQDDWNAYNRFTAEIGEAVQVVGDDLLVTNPKRVQQGIDGKACNALLLKVNQIGSVTESIEAANLSMSAGWGVMVSHRSGETDDTFIADLAVGLRTGQIKTGAPCRSERLAKYNQLLRIEDDLGVSASFAGEGFRSVGSFLKGMFRKPVVGGNWKSNGTLKTLKDLLSAFNAVGADPNRVDTVIFPVSLHLFAAQKALPQGSAVALGLQNISKTAEGAFTGEVTCAMAKDLGIPWVLIGHSERRSLYGETDAETAEKVAKAQEHGLLSMIDWTKVVIAYEPVWAIGTGVVATPLQAQDAHLRVRQLIHAECGAEVANAVRILYGGSVNPKNCKELSDLPDVDGFLVGGASLKPDFGTIIS